MSFSSQCFGLVCLLMAAVAFRYTHAHECCLCDDCDFMMRSDADLYDSDKQMFVSCERFAEEIFLNFEAGGPQCSMAQELFKTPCCFMNHDESTEGRRLLFGATTYTFQSGSFNNPSSYSSWGAMQSSPSTASWGKAPSYETGEVFSVNTGVAAGASCPRRSGICDFNCPNVPADRQAIHVSVDPSITGRTDIPYFGALCGDVQNQFHCQNVLSSDLRCNLMVARYRGECGCGGYQNNGAAFFGTTQSSGTVGEWTIKSTPFSTPNGW